jgi:hypothetical protein
MTTKSRRPRSGAAPGSPDPTGAGALDHGHVIEAARRRQIFIVSVSDEGGDLRGVVEAVRSGWKERFRGLDALAPVIAAMLGRLRRDDALAPGETRRAT